MDVVYGQELSLVGVAEEWEGNGVLRARHRDHRRLFQRSGFPDDFNPPAHVKEAAFNHSVLHPIIKRMGQQLDAEGHVQLFTIKQVEAEMLGP